MVVAGRPLQICGFCFFVRFNHLPSGSIAIFSPYERSSARMLAMHSHLHWIFDGSDAISVDAKSGGSSYPRELLADCAHSGVGLGCRAGSSWNLEQHLLFP